MKQSQLRQLTEISQFAALICVVVFFIRIPFGSQFVHLGNALVVVGVLIFGAKKGALAASLGLGIFDLLSGYASVAWITILESLIVCFVLHLFYEKFLQANDSLSNIMLVGIVAAITKIILNLLKYTLTGSFVGGLTPSASFLAALGRILGTYGTAITTIIAVPILYQVCKRLYGRK
ncbi:TPA: ECF transporter S component [Streptococcus suis]|nr:ECF transporter S component [Streptococcus suis]HEM5153584.1 ECF transporter S component [Streptococcus suis]HEM5180906.1 ECF transporter S component [Streptococcus suis]HEM5282166.1 ECF transporter S component [Streptococcus suis]